jgi:hypothetical protein
MIPRPLAVRRHIQTSFAIDFAVDIVTAAVLIIFREKADT